MTRVILIATVLASACTVEPPAPALGVANAYLEYWTDASLAKAAVFALIVVFLQFRPQGLVVTRRRGLA